jgi:hypothetical protein
MRLQRDHLALHATLLRRQMVPSATIELALSNHVASDIIANDSHLY